MKWIFFLFYHQNIISLVCKANGSNEPTEPAAYDYDIFQCFDEQVLMYQTYNFKNKLGNKNT